MQDRLINDVSLDKGDKKLLAMLKNHLVDMLQNSYCPLIE